MEDSYFLIEIASLVGTCHLGDGFQDFLVSIPIWGNDPIWLAHIFSNGLKLNHHLVMVHFTGKNSHGDSLVSVATSLPWSTHYVGTLLGLPAWDVNRPDASQVGEFCVCILANLAGVYCIYIYIHITCKRLVLFWNIPNVPTMQKSQTYQNYETLEGLDICLYIYIHLIVQSKPKMALIILILALEVKYVHFSKQLWARDGKVLLMGWQSQSVNFGAWDFFPRQTIMSKKMGERIESPQKSR